MYSCLLNVLSSEAPDLEEIAKDPGVVGKYLDENLPKLFSLLVQVVIAVVILIIGMKIIKWITKLCRKPLEKGRIDKSVINFLVGLIKYVLYFLLIMIILQSFGVTTGSVVAILGSAGLTMGLALQGSLSNFASGVLILVIKPFVVGDYIIIAGSGLEGTVDDISMFYTRLKTIDNKVVMVPNGNLSNTSITNVSMLDKRRVDIKVGVAYNSDIQKTKDILTKVAKADERVLTEEPLDVFVDELADSAVVFGIRVWVHKQDYFATKWALNENVKIALDENGIEIPFNQVDVHIC